MATFYRGAYRRWLEETTTRTLLIYSVLIVTLLPAFHFVLSAIPGIPPDSMALRVGAATVSLIIGLAVWLLPALRRYSPELQLLNLLPTVIVVPILVVNSGNNALYISASLLVAVGAQQGFYRARDLVALSLAACACEALYSASLGIFYQPANIVALAIVGTGWLIGAVIGSLRINIQQNELRSRLDAQRMKDDLDRMAHIDTLTELPNRQTLLERLHAELSQDGESHCAVLFLDLDRFKDVNDALGHDIGDSLLHAVAARFSALVPEGALLARWGGDEFVAIVRSVDGESTAKALANRLVHATGEPFLIEGSEFIVSVSIGIAIYPKHGGDPQTLIRNADAAMYRAKASQGIRFSVFENEMHAAAVLRQRILNELRKAPNDGSLELYYQPIVETATTRVVGAEALLRWRQSDGEVLEPSHFIPIAEKSGLIVPIGAWVLHTACRQLRTWQDAGKPLSLAVNISAHQLAHPDFVDLLRNAIRESDIDPGLLEIEITETTMMDYVDEILQRLHEIKTLGVTVTIDDFGTGYSSFAYLKRFPLDSLKLDRTFVTGLEYREDREIVASLITIAQALGMKVTAEGVESRAQFEILAASRCDHIQGYLVGRPLPLADFERLHSNDAISGAPSRRPSDR